MTKATPKVRPSPFSRAFGPGRLCMDIQKLNTSSYQIEIRLNSGGRRRSVPKDSRAADGKGNTDTTYGTRVQPAVEVGSIEQKPRGVSPPRLLGPAVSIRRIVPPVGCPYIFRWL